MATVIENQCISYNELEILKILTKLVYRFKRQFWEYKNFVQKETAQTAIVNYRRFMEHVPILVAMPFWCLPDQGMLKVVSLAPKPQWVTKTEMREAERRKEMDTKKAMTQLTCLPARARRVNFLPLGGAYKMTIPI